MRTNSYSRTESRTVVFAKPTSIPPAVDDHCSSMYAVGVRRSQQPDSQRSDSTGRACACAATGANTSAARSALDLQLFRGIAELSFVQVGRRYQRMGGRLVR